ncbi:acyl-CoA desaturase [Actinocorallia aurea]
MTETLVAPRTGSDFTPLARQVRASGLMERRTAYYGRSIAFTTLATIAVWAAAGAVGGWWALPLAVPAALLSARMGFLGHDAGHKQIAATAQGNRRLGLFLGNLMLGLSHGWWNHKHNAHHAHPNHVGKDPDIGAGALVFTKEDAVGRTSGLIGWLTRNQAVLFFPLTTLEGIALQVSSVQTLKERPAGERRTEGLLLAAHHVLYFGAAFLLLPVPVALAFMALHQALFGLHLGAAFAPNHKGMPMPGPDDDWDHLRKQVLTSRNIRGGAVTDWMLGGLNYQIEHHLFPALPRPALHKAQPLVRAHCESLGLPYTETSLLTSYAIALRHLDSLA